MTGQKSKGKCKSGFFAALRMTNLWEGANSRFPAGMTGQKSKGKSKSGFFPFAALRVRMTNLWGANSKSKSGFFPFAALRVRMTNLWGVHNRAQLGPRRRGRGLGWILM